MSINYTSDVGEVSRRMRTGERIMVLVAMGYGKLRLKCLGGEDVAGTFRQLRTVTNNEARFGFVVVLQTKDYEDPRDVDLAKITGIEGVDETTE